MFSSPAFQRLKAVRDSGWTGPVDRDGNAVMTRTSRSGKPLYLTDQGSTGHGSPDETAFAGRRRPARS